jgi:hypothetical protein
MKFHPPNKLFTRAYRKFLHRPMKDVITKAWLMRSGRTESAIGEAVVAD